MKKYFLLVFLLTGMLCTTAACKDSQVKQDNTKASTQVSSESERSDISIISREEGSGTRDSFIQISGVLQKDAEGRYVDRTISQAMIVNDSEEVIRKVANDKNAIGYLSLGEYL
ncbi:MAG: hypothetical protein Q4D45_03785 [Lachnospiraceae bacterium]|nr:hypothetical protein [Lachnospiraceae bacterium]